MGRLRGAHLTMVHNGETASVYRRFPRGQKSMWLSEASVLKKVLQGGIVVHLYGANCNDSYEGLQKGVAGNRIFSPKPEVRRSKWRGHQMRGDKPSKS